ncbi:MAG: hypothetical protein ABIT83_18645 [Massilia sp.]
MSDIRLDLFDRRFDDLVEIGRARIPNLAPGWTDHNLHDPGITLMELLAWTAEAQIFALSRLRKDERIAYAAMLGIMQRGPRAATGDLWPIPGAAPPPGQVLSADTPITVTHREAPTFWPRAPILLAPARIDAVRSLRADGSIIDHSKSNLLDGAVFQPFGEGGETLAISLSCAGASHLFEGAPAGGDAQLAIGVQIPGPAPAEAPPTRLRITLVTPQRRQELKLAWDGTAGFAHSGVLLLEARPDAPIHACTLEIVAPGGFAHAPRIQCVGLNVVPLIQSTAVQNEQHVGDGLPDQVFRCEEPGFEYQAGSAPPLTVVSGDGAQWSLRQSLDTSGPDDHHLMFDPAAATLVFGNGVNGRVPGLDEILLLGYRASAGAAGNLPRRQQWKVRGLTFYFGGNPDPVTGGEDAPGMDELRRAARRSVRNERALVSADDLVAAALALSDLELVRALVIGPGQRGACVQPQGDVLTLVAMRARSDDPAATESALWLRAVRARLAPRLPLGTRLRVVAPRYLPLRLKVRLLAAPMQDPAMVVQAAKTLLAQRLALTAPTPAAVWPFGAPLTATSVAAWLSRLPGVQRVAGCELLAGTSDTPVARATPPALSGLLLLDLDGSDIQAQRAGSAR